MLARIRYGSRWATVAPLLLLLAAIVPATPAQDKKPEKLAEPIAQGQRVFTCGHSFHVFVPGILTDLAKKGDVKEHVQAGMSSIGGSRVIQHWDVAEDKNKAKEALKTGKVDVLTLSPIHLPDPGIENFAKLALEHNKDIRVTVQAVAIAGSAFEPEIPGSEDTIQGVHGEKSRSAFRMDTTPYFC